MISISLKDGSFIGEDKEKREAKNCDFEDVLGEDGELWAPVEKIIIHSFGK